MAKKFRTTVGDPAGQTTWEYLMLYVALFVWASDFRSGLLLLGDNISSLAGVINLRGKSVLNLITKEVAWRKVRCQWRFAAGHLPSELNLLADCLSRLAAPAGSEHRLLPPALSQVPAIDAPDFADLWVCS